MKDLYNEIKSQFGQCYNGGAILFISDHKKFLFSSGNFISMVDLISKKIQPLKFRLRSVILVFDIDKTGKYLAVVDDTNLLLVISIHESVITNKILLKDKCFCLKWSPVGKYVLLGIKNFVQVWKTNVYSSVMQTSFQLSRTYTGHYGDVSDIDWNFSGDFFISGGSDGVLKIFSFRKKNGFCQIKFGNSKERILSVKFYSFSNRFLILCQNNILHTYQISVKKKQKSRSKTFVVRKLFNSKIFLRDVTITCVFFNFFSKLLFIGNSRGNVEIFFIPEYTLREKNQKKTKKHTKFQVLQRIKFSNFFLSNINSLSVCRNNNFIVIGHFKKGKVLVYDQKQKKTILTYENTIFGSNCISISPNDKMSIIGNQKGFVNIWSIRSGFCIIKFRSHSKCVNRVLFFKNSSRLALSSSKDRTVKIYDIKKGLVIRTLNYFSQTIDFDFITSSYSGFFVASTCRKTFHIYVWSLKTGEIVDILKGHKGYISNLFFVEKKMKIISGSWDNTFRLWNFEKTFSSQNKCFCEVFRTHNSILNIKESPNSNEIALLIRNDSVFFFDLAKHICLNRIRKCYFYLFKKNKFFENYSFNFSLIYSFNGKIILIGNSTKKIFSFSRYSPFITKTYNIPSLRFYSRFFLSFNKSKKKKKNFRSNYVIDLSSCKKNNDWIALSMFGVFLFQIKYAGDIFFGDFYFFSCRKFRFFLDKTFFWIYSWKKNINYLIDLAFIFTKIFSFFIDDIKKDQKFNFYHYQMKQIFKIKKKLSIKEIFFLFNIFSKINLEKYSTQEKKKIIQKFKKFKFKILKKVDGLIYRLLFFIKFKKMLDSFR